MRIPKIPIAVLALSAAGLVGLVQQEGYTDRAVRPTPVDKWTVGFGSTTRADGSPVQPGDATTPPAALARTLAWVQDGERKFKQCVRAPLTPGEYDLYVDFMYNVGVGGFCNSTMVKLLNQQKYVEACNEFPKWKYHKGHDCSVPGNKICGGLWQRRLHAQQTCIGQQ